MADYLWLCAWLMLWFGVGLAAYPFGHWVGVRLYRLTHKG